MNIRNILILITIVIIAGVSCEQQIWTLGVDCDECFIDKPDSADLVVYITINEENQRVPLEFYKGDIEEGNLDWRDTADSDILYLYSEIDEYYSIKAYYKQGTQTLIATDGSKLKRALVSDLCTDASNEVTVDCWIIKDGILDVRIKE